MGKVINGKLIAQKIEKKLKKKLIKIKPKLKLAVIQVGSDPASVIYIKNKREACRRVGVESRVIRIKAGKNQKAIRKNKNSQIEKIIKKLNKDKRITGILVQLPLPRGLNTQKILAAIDLKKDVDCLNPDNFKKIGSKEEKIIPCTPKGILRLINDFQIPIKKKKIIIIGRSKIVGLPLIKIFNSWGVKVISCDRRTKDLKKETKKADIIITAVGKKDLIKKDMVKKGVVILDVGIMRKKGKIYGDVEYAEVKKIASLITPVPGGIGPITVAELLENLLICFENQKDNR